MFTYMRMMNMRCDDAMLRPVTLRKYSTWNFVIAHVLI